MIKLKCRHHEREHGDTEGKIISEEMFPALVKLLTVVGPSEEAHAVLLYDCEGKTPMEELEHPGQVLRETEAALAEVKNLKDLFPE